MTVLQMITELQRKGYKVVAYKRKDGSYVIQSINGVKYVGKSGNAKAREILGQTLSVKRAEQLKRITKPKTVLPAEAQKELDRLQRAWRKSFGARSQKGVVRKKNVGESIERKGLEETIRLLKSQQRYAKGLAYIENINHLIERINSFSNFSEYKDDWKQIVKRLESIKERFYETDLQDILITLGSPKIGTRLDLSEKQQIEAINKILDKYNK